MFNNHQTLNCINNKQGCPCHKNCGCFHHSNCKFKNQGCIRKETALDSLFCVEKFLCCSQKACNFCKLIRFFN